MVSTRNHPSNFPPPSNPPSTTSSPTKRPPRTPSPSHSISSTRGQQNHATASTRRPWSHTPTHLTLLWLLLSLPLVIWDTGYVLLRPHSMPGGSLHSPLWIPYALYGTVDYIYGWPAFEARNGFTSAQGVMNLVETALYGGYVWGCWVWGREQKDVEGRGVKLGAWGAMARTVSGKKAAWLVVVGFSAAVLTVGKTVLYCECCLSSFWKYHRVGSRMKAESWPYKHEC